MRKYLLRITFFIGGFLSTAQAQNPENITIARDAYGVPHIFGATDADAVYGLGWTHCEDNFAEMQNAMLYAVGRRGEVYGAEGAASDYFFHYVRAKQIAYDEYENRLPPEFKKIVTAYSAAINRYAELHPKEILLKDLFPMRPQDVIAGMLVTLSAMVGTADALTSIINGKPDEYMFRPGGGSNGFAYSSKITADGKTYLCVNPHVPYDGTFTFYEAHLQSGEGLNMHGAMFPGMICPAMGNNDNLGWALTFNWPDFVDIYALELNPQNKNQYKFDGQWIDFERTMAPLKVKVGPIKINVKKEVLYCKYGPAFRTKDGKVHATRFAALDPVRAMEQWFKMCKAQNFKEFKEILKMQGIPLFNIIYADKEDNIYYCFNAALPKRDPRINWQMCPPGNTSQTLWTEYLPLDSMPQVQNPSCGYVYNTNNSPFYCTGPAENPRPERYPSTCAFEWNRQNNRDRRFRELIYPKKKITFDEMKAFKWDVTYPKDGAAQQSFSVINKISPQKYPDIAPALEILKKWNFKGDLENKEASLALLTFYYVFKKLKASFVEIEGGFVPPEDLTVEGIRDAQKKLLKTYGTLTPTLRQTQYMARGKNQLPIAGLPETLAPAYLQHDNGGRIESELGDTYVSFIVFGKNGVERVETIVPFGSSNRPESPHFFDQAPLFVAQKTKVMTMDKNVILKNAKKTYKPQ